MAETRKLAAILVADVVGFSRLTGADEDRTLARLRALRSDVVDPTIAVHKGHVVKRTGDGVLVEFRSVVEAVRCAVEIQNAMVERNAGVPAERRIDFRIGVHLGDVVEESDGDLMGDGVNIAARLEGIAQPGAICLSEDAYRQVKGRLDPAVTDLGPTRLKNIAEPIRVYSLQVGPPARPKPSESKRRLSRLPLTLGIAALAVLAGASAWRLLGGTQPAPVSVTALALEAPKAAAPSQAPHLPEMQGERPNATAEPSGGPKTVASTGPAQLSDEDLRQQLRSRLAAFSISDHDAADQAQAYAARPGHKALAATAGSSWRATARTSEQTAADDALEACQISSNIPCSLVATDETVFPPSADRAVATDMPQTQYEGLFDPERVPVVNNAVRTRKDVATYRSVVGPKAIAFHPWGLLFVATDADTQRMAEEFALSRCNLDPDRNGRTAPAFSMPSEIASSCRFGLHGLVPSPRRFRKRSAIWTYRKRHRFAISRRVCTGR